MAVVDLELGVRACGIARRRRVGDATVVSGQHHAATIMIGERCAVLARQEVRSRA